MMSENPLAFGMVYVVVKLALCHVFQRVLFFVVFEDAGYKPDNAATSGEQGFKMWADAGENGIRIAFSVYPAGVGRGGTGAVTGGDAGMKVAVFVFEAVGALSTSAQAVARGCAAAAKDEAEIGDAVGAACLFEGSDGSGGDTASVVLVGIGGVAVAVADVPRATREAGQDGLFEMGMAGGEDEQQFADGVGMGGGVKQDGAQLFAEGGAARLAAKAGFDVVGAAPRTDVGELGGFADTFAAIQRDEATVHGLFCCFFR